MKIKLGNPFRSLSHFERILWITSLILVTGSFLCSPEKNVLSLIASLIGVTALIFLAKGYVIGQVLIDRTSLTPARILTGFVVAGVLLSAIGLYEPLAELAGAGATVPLSGFGHLMAQGVKEAVDQDGAIGILTGALTASAAGIGAAVVLSLTAGLLGKPREK